MLLKPNTKRSGDKNSYCHSPGIDEKVRQCDSVGASANNVSEFRIEAWKFNEKSGVLELKYGWSNGEIFVEKLEFGISQSPDQVDTNAIERLAAFLHVACGVSYYKAAMPPKLIINNGLSQIGRDFFVNFYFQGLAEFAFRNNVDLSDRLNFSHPLRTPEPIATQLPKRSLLPIGGGKDSLTSVAFMQNAGRNFSLFSVNPSHVTLQCAKISGVPLVQVRRTLSANLFSLNERGYPNGHVPITGIISLIASFAAVWHGYDEIVMSNERSANIGNVRAFGIDVNHQYSKSLDFEKRLRNLIVKDGVKNLNYFSLLRPLSELNIAKKFAVSSSYDEIFTSCNRVFRIKNPETDRLWCGECPKCHFVFLCLATSIDKKRLLQIFGQNLLDTPRYLASYSQIVGVSGHKPWECVGETSEAAAAIGILAKSEQWRTDCIISELWNILAVESEKIEHAIDDAYIMSDEHFVPDDLIPYLL